MSRQWLTMRRFSPVVGALVIGACLPLSSCWLFSSFGDLRSTPEDSSVSLGDSSVSPGDSSVSHPYPTEVMKDAPLVYLRFGERQGPTALDETGHDNGVYPGVGVLYGAPGALAGDSNTAVRFDGSAGITMPPAPGLDFVDTAPFSIEVWAKLDELGTSGWWWIVDHQKYVSSTDREGWDVLIDWTGTYGPPGRWVSERNRQFIGSDTVGSTVGLSSGKYHYLVATFDGQRQGIYIDGQLQHESGNTPLPSLLMTNIPWTVGSTTWGGQGFIGLLDELAIYSIALGQDRILAHYRAAMGP
jgi:hypothetical protein